MSLKLTTAQFNSIYPPPTKTPPLNALTENENECLDHVTGFYSVGMALKEAVKRKF